MSLNEVFDGVHQAYTEKWRVMLRAEDGEYCVKDNISSIHKANIECDKLSANYGEGQYLYIEPYQPGY